ncbi:hypothetical protein GWO13_00110 [Candidatus Bathyarchaeota archaeon]|nr:hypothetical protein [Candidatus Bathyarchaeota archaeon]
MQRRSLLLMQCSHRGKYCEKKGDGASKKKCASSRYGFALRGVQIELDIPYEFTERNKQQIKAYVHDEF